MLSWFSKYSFVLMDRLAEGVVEPPVLSTEMVNPLRRAAPDDHAGDDDRAVLRLERGKLLGGQAARSC
jgi:hypothetical protein